MNIRILFVTMAAFAISTTLFAQEEQKQKTPEDMALMQTTKLELDLSLEPHQTFYVDSILTGDYRAWSDEMEAMKKTGTTESVVYKQINDKWLAHIDTALHKVFTQEQWTEYLKITGKLKKEKKPKKGKK